MSDWGQQQELSFIAGIGKPDPSSQAPHFRSKAYAEKCVRGYIQSLFTRKQWWVGVDVPQLQKAAERRLLQVIGVPSAPH